MPDDSIGRVQLDIEIPSQAMDREATRAGGAIQRALGNSLRATQHSIRNMFSGLTRGGREGAESIDSMSTEAETLTQKLDNINAQIEIQEQRLARLREQYSYLSETGLGDSDRALKMQEQIAKTEASIIKLTQQSDKAAQALWNVDDALRQTGNTSEETGTKVSEMGNQMSGAFGLASRGATNMANSISKAFTRVLRRVLLFGVMYRAVRGFISFMGDALRTNDRFANSLDIIRTNLRVAFQPIFQAVLPAITALTRGLATATTYIAAFISALFGQSYQASYDAAEQLEEARDSMEGYGDAAKDTRKALMGFDEINLLGRPVEDTGPGTHPGFVMPDTREAEAGANRLLELLQPTIDAIGRLWEAVLPFAQPIGQGLQAFWSDVLVPFGEWLLSFGIPGLLDLITEALTRLSDWAAANPAVVDTMVQLILGFLAGLWVYNTTKKIITFLTGLGTTLRLLAANITLAGAAAGLGAIAFAALLGGVLALALNWNKMNGIERTIGILGAIAVAAAAAAVAVGALQSAWSLGIAAAAIVAGTAAIAYAVSSANKRAGEGLENLGSTSQYSANTSATTSAVSRGGSRNTTALAMATGGIVDQPTLALIGEQGREAVVPLQNNTEWMDTVAGRIAERLQDVAGEGPWVIQVNVGGKKIHEEVVSAAKRKNTRAGRTVVPVGV